MTQENKTPRFGNAAKPELILKNGDLAIRDGIRLGFTRCFTCNNMCGLRYRVDIASDTITRLAGNPYCEVVTGGDPLPLDLPVKQAYALLMGETGQKCRATSCGKGASGLDCVNDPRRVLSVLKRAGKRGEDKWITIPYEQALQEIIEGGDLFGEGHVDGLRAIRDLKNPVKPGYPEFGPKANQLFATFNEEDTLRGSLYSRFMTKAFGTVNLTTKHAYCGAGVGVGYSLGLAPEVSAGMCDVDWDFFEYALFIGTNPGGSGASINRTGRAVANARTDRQAKYVCVDPILRDSVAKNTNAQWQPILPGTDTAFLYGMIRVMLENGWYDNAFLSLPNEEAAKDQGEINWSNATYLVDIEKQALADAADFGLGKKGEALVYVNGKLELASTAKKGETLVSKVFQTKEGKDVLLVSSLQLLKDQAMKYPLEVYSQICQIPVDRIKDIARNFSHHGRQVVAVSNTGNNSVDAAMSAWLICILNTLVACHDVKGGAIYGNGAFMGFEGPYNLDGFDGQVSTEGQMNVCLNGAYETSTEYKKKVEMGKNPYPANHVYHPMFPEYTAGNAAEMFTALANNDPYPAKALINWRSNVLFSASSIDHRVEEIIADPKNLPLFVAIDAFVNETNRYADYIIPDRVMFEEYGCDRTWGNFYQCVVAGVPVVSPRTVVNKKGQHVCMEEFLIDVALALELPGFGKGAIPVAKGEPVDLLSFDDWHVRYLANVASQCEHLPEVTFEDRQFAALGRAMAEITPRLQHEEAAKVEALLSRGGYYDKGEKYDGDFLVNGGGKFLQFFNPAMPQIRHCYSGKPYPGVPVMDEPKFFNGDVWTKHWNAKDFPLRFASYKPTLRSNYSATFDHCADVTPTNFIYMHKLTAGKYSLKDGDKARIVSGNGVPVVGMVKTDKSVALNAVCVAHTYGHTAYGSEDRTIDGKTYPGIKRRGGGTAVNQMIPHDPTRQGVASMLNDYYVAANCRTGIPVRVEKIEA